MRGDAIIPPPGERLLVALPDTPLGADANAHWWRVRGDGIVDRGIGTEWLERGAAIACIGLAPASRVRLSISPLPEGVGNPRQAIGVARNAAVEDSLGDAATLQVVSVPFDELRLATAVVANVTMVEWLDWADAAGASLDRIVPAAMALPHDDRWSRIAVGSETIVGQAGLVAPDEPALIDQLLPPDTQIDDMDPDAIEAAFVRIAGAPEPNLRSGRFAPRRVIVDRSTVRQLALIAAAIGLVTLLTAIVQIVRLDSSSAAVDRDAVAAAQRVLGPSATLETAERDLAARGGAANGMSSAAAGLFQRLQGEPDVALTAFAFARGTVTATLAAPGTEAINRLLAALQRDGYRVTAVPRQGSDGRNMADITMRGGS